MSRTRGTNKRTKSVKNIILFAVALVFNIIPVVFAAIGGSLMENGKLGMSLLNIMVIIMMVILVNYQLVLQL